MHDLHTQAFEEDGTLFVGLRVGIYDPELLRIPPGREVVADRHIGLSCDGDAELNEALERLPHAAGLGVLDRHKAVN